MVEKNYLMQGKHLDGKGLAWYRDLSVNKMSGFNSYAAAWESLKPLRDIVGM